MEDVIRLEGVTLRRGGRTILDSIDWRVGKGRCCAMLGPNGAGKSTLLAIVTGFMWPQEGRVFVFGEQYGRVELGPLRRRIGIVGHSRLPEFHGDMTAFETVLAGRWGTIVIPPRVKIEERDIEAARRELAAAGLERFADQYFENLSGGEQMRLQLARAVVADPELLILDEPTTGLDLGGRAAFNGALERLLAARPNLTAIVVTHAIEDLPTSLDDVLLLRDGRIVASGPAREHLTSENLSRAFGCEVELIRRNGHFQAQVTPMTDWNF
ncbi:ATP-binding cassette domain-containing protein [bacterium]|nr:ATP-binding cassette domain-containing protein [bacterium]